MHPKKELVRIVRSPEGKYSLDLTGKKSGRGAYICRNRECFDQARKFHRFEKSFQAPMDPGVYEEMERELFRGEKDE